ncbi:MAG: hypothetical protein WD049_05250 [Candidatus Paceibacterota bacterium]
MHVQSDLQQYKKQLLEMRNRSRPESNRVIVVVLDDAEAAGEHDRKVSESVDKRALIVRRKLIDT